MPTEADIQLEQEHFDAAWEAREESRRTLLSAPSHAAGSRAAVSALNKSATKLAAQLGQADDAIAFGRIDTEDGETYYVGKHGIADGDRNRLVIQWQLPVVAPYYKARYDDTLGLVRKRKFDTDRNTVRDFEETIFSQLAESVAALTEPERIGIDDTVLRDLDRDRDGAMRDIVQTIHAAQYDLIEAPLDQLLVVQGGPGTGKTAVALHRASWLLYNHTELDAGDVLIVGPNPTFTRYIRKVLPALGDGDVQHKDLRALGPQVSSRRAESPEIARIKGEERMAALLRTALFQRVRFPVGQDEINFGTRYQAAALTRGVVEEELSRLERESRTYTVGRAAFRAWLLRRAGSNVPSSQVDSVLDRIWPSLTPQRFLQELLGSRERLMAAGGDLFTAGDIQRLQRGSSAKLSEELWSDSDVALLDEAEDLISGGTPTFTHVVLDEAQDLSPMQLRSVARRSAEGSMTVVGDIAQSTGPWARDGWDDVVRILRQENDARVEELTLGYRVPEQIFALAAQLLPEAAPQVTPPRVVRRGPADPDLREVGLNDCAAEAVAAARDYAGRGLFVGVVCPELLRDDLLTEFKTADVAFTDASDGGLSTSINVVGPEEAKGLEFDAVVVVEPVEIVDEVDRGLRTLYVALTRTTRFLTVVHSGVVLPLGNATRPADVTSNVAIASGPLATLERGTSLVGEPDAAIALAASSSPSSTSAGTSQPDPLDEMTRTMIGAMASSMAQSIKASLAPGVWPHFIEELRDRLDP